MDRSSNRTLKLVQVGLTGVMLLLLSLIVFRDFVFGNPVSFFGGMNPDFFKGTVVEEEANRVTGVSG